MLEKLIVIHRSCQFINIPTKIFKNSDVKEFASNNI